MRYQTIPRENGWEAGAGLVSISPGFLTFTGLLCTKDYKPRTSGNPIQRHLMLRFIGLLRDGAVISIVSC